LGTGHKRNLRDTHTKQAITTTTATNTINDENEPTNRAASNARVCSHAQHGVLVCLTV
jgi:hypothetical protein